MPRGDRRAQADEDLSVRVRERFGIAVKPRTIESWRKAGLYLWEREGRGRGARLVYGADAEERTAALHEIMREYGRDAAAVVLWLRGFSLADEETIRDGYSRLLTDGDRVLGAMRRSRDPGMAWLRRVLRVAAGEPAGRMIGRLGRDAFVRVAETVLGVSLTVEERAIVRDPQAFLRRLATSEDLREVERRLPEARDWCEFFGAGRETILAAVALTVPSIRRFRASTYDRALAEVRRQLQSGRAA